MAIVRRPRRLDGSQIVQRATKRLFDEHMLAGLEGREHLSGVRVIVRRDGDEVDR